MYWVIKIGNKCMASKADVKRARVAGMYEILALYKSSRDKGNTEGATLSFLEKYISDCQELVYRRTK